MRDDLSLRTCSIEPSWPGYATATDVKSVSRSVRALGQGPWCAPQTPPHPYEVASRRQTLTPRPVIIMRFDSSSCWGMEWVRYCAPLVAKWLWCSVWHSQRMIDSLDCRVSLTVKNPNGRFSITQYRCSSDGAPCDDIGVFSEPQRRPRKATGRDEVCVTFKSLNGSRGNAALIVRASPR